VSGLWLMLGGGVHGPLRPFVLIVQHRDDGPPERWYEERTMAEFRAECSRW
jgi:hypothetical protein